MRKLIVLFLTIGGIFGLQGCGNQDENSVTGRLVIKMTDAPFDYSLVKEANVTIGRIELRSKDEEGSEKIMLSEEEVELNLLDLQNGITAELVDLEVPAGNYDLIRLYISKSGLVLEGDQEFDLKVPSGAQSGLKVFVHPNITVTGGLTTELLLDFDVSKSFVPKGNLIKGKVEGFNFKPVIRAVNIATTGRIEGMVYDSTELAVSGAMAWIENDTVVATTLSDESGFYALTGIPAGEYELYCTKEGYDTLKVQDVKVDAGNKTEIDAEINLLTE